MVREPHIPLCVAAYGKKRSIIIGIKDITVAIQRKKGFFSISAVAKMFSVHQQTVRLYEKEGLICPKRSAGNTRLFSEEDIDQLEEVIYLTHQLGINLAGVEMILKLKKQINSMKKEMNKLFDKTEAQLDKQTDISKQLVKASIKQLHSKKKTDTITPNMPNVTSKKPDEQPEEPFDVDDWNIEYD